MTRNAQEQVAAMLKEIQAGRGDPLEASSNHTPPPDTPEENALPAAEDTEAIHVFFVRESQVQQALLDAKTVEAEAGTPQPVPPAPASTNTVTRKTALSVGIFTVCVLTSILLLLLFIVPKEGTPVATVTITPKTVTVSTTATMRLHVRVLPALTLSQSQTVPATGKRHQTATEAQGSITFFNGLYISQTVASGTILTGAHGVQIITDQPAVIPEAFPPGLGQTTIRAHAIDKGAQGNIPKGDINQECCLTAVKAVNTEAFTGGQNARDYTVVTRTDMQNAASPLHETLLKSEQAALEVQLNPGEALIPPLCREQVKSDHQPGEEAEHVTVAVSDTCEASAYDAHTLYTNATQFLTTDALNRLGTGYIPVGDTQVTIIHIAITDHARGIATIVVKLDATYVYQISPGEKQQLLHLIAGKTKQQAVQALLRMPGIQGARISGNAATVPTDPGSITIVIMERL